MKFGIHAGPQDLTMDELIRLWKTADDNGFHWVSVWDHFYANPLHVEGGDRGRDNPCFEAVATMAGLAAHTKNVRVGCLVFCALFRTPGMLAKAAVTIDHLSQGRAEIGIGAGWFEEEFREFGYGFPPLGQRLDQLEEALAIIRSLWRDDVTHFKGEYYDVQGAVCAPKPYNPRMKIWIGGTGRSRTPKIAAKFADGFNLPYVPPKAAATRLAVMRQECERIGRDPAEIETSVNLGFYLGDRKPEMNPDGCITGSVQAAIDKIGQYQDMGIEGVNIAFRPPVDWEGLARYIEEVMPRFK